MASRASSTSDQRLDIAVIASGAPSISYAHRLEASGRARVSLIASCSHALGLGRKSAVDVTQAGETMRWKPYRIIDSIDAASDRTYAYVIAEGCEMSGLNQLLQSRSSDPAPILVLLDNSTSGAPVSSYSSLTLRVSARMQATISTSGDTAILDYRGLDRVTLSVGSGADAGPAVNAALNEFAGLLQASGSQVTLDDSTQGSTWSRASWETATPPNGLYVETTVPVSVSTGSSSYSHTMAQRRPQHRDSMSQVTILDSPTSAGPPLYEAGDYPSPFEASSSPKIGFVSSPIYDTRTSTSSSGIWKYAPTALRDWVLGKQRLRSAEEYAEKGRRRRTSSFNTYLPFNRNGSWRRRGKSKRSTYAWALLVLLGIIGLIYVKRTYEFQVEISAYSKPWIQQEVDNVPELSGCFAPNRVSPKYDLSLHTSPKHHSLSPGVSLRRGLSCYDFAASIQSSPHAPLTPLIYHTYWRADLLPFGERQAATITSFLATQPLSHSRLILWTNGAEALKSNSHVRRFLDTWPEYVEVRGVDMEALAVGTALEDTGLIGDKVLDRKAWVDGDAVRLLVLWGFGGVWMDMDQILTRDLHPLVEHEFVTQWDCYDKPYLSLNGALMHFRQHSPYLCEAFHIMASSPRPQPNTFTWGALLYAKLHRALLKAHQTPFAVLPWCFADPRNCREDIRFPDPFKPNPDYWGGERWDDRGREALEQRVGQVWSVHLHNQWEKAFPSGGWIERLLDNYAAQLNALEIFAKVQKGRRQ